MHVGLIGPLIGGGLHVTAKVRVLRLAFALQAFSVQRDRSTRSSAWPSSPCCSWGW